MEELEDDLRVPDSSILARDDHVGLVVAARHRLRLAAAALRAERPRDGFLQKLVLVSGITLRGVVLAALGAAFLVRLVSRSMRGLVRLVFTLRAI